MSMVELERRKVLTAGDKSCALKYEDHAYMPLGETWFDNNRSEHMKFATIYCTRCGETVKVLYADNIDNG